MRTPSPTSLLTLSLLSLGLVACSDPPPPSEVRARITDDLGHVLRESAAATEGATAELAGGGTFGLLERALGQADSGTTFRTLRDVATRLTGTGRTASRAPFAPADPVEGGLDTDAIVAELNQTIFTDANHVGDGVYAIPVELACETTTWDDLGNEITQLDPDCAAQWDKLALRIRVEGDDDELRFALQLGAGHDEPLILGLTHTSLALTVDLDEAEAATRALASAFGEEAPNARIAGRLTGKLAVLGPAHVEASLTIDRALAIAVADAGVSLDGPDAVRFGSAAGKITSVELDGNAATGTFSVGLGATTVHAPGADGFDLDLAGATATAELAAGQPLRLTNLSLGDRTTTLTRNGAVALAIDLNADAGRKLDATITADAVTGLETLTVTPKLDVSIAIDHAALGDTAPVYDVTRLVLDGSLRGGATTDQVEVVTGTFAISTSPAQYGFSATAGQCVASSEAFDQTLGEYFTQWSVGTCQ